MRFFPKSQALHRKFTVTLLFPSPVSFWRNVWYNGFAVHPAYLTGEEVDALAYFLTFLSLLYAILRKSQALCVSTK